MGVRRSARDRGSGEEVIKKGNSGIRPSLRNSGGAIVMGI